MTGKPGGGGKHNYDHDYLSRPRRHHMPIGGKPLPETTLTALAAAIDSLTPLTPTAAKDHAGWTFTAPAEPKLPTPRNSAWVRNPIDAFVLAKLEEKGFAPAPAATKRTLIWS